MRPDGLADRRGRQGGEGLVVGVDRKRAVRGEDGLLPQPAFAREGFEQLLGRVLRLLHVRLVERVDAETPAGEGRGDLPEEELFAEVVGVRERAVDYGVACGFERLELRLDL